MHSIHNSTNIIQEIACQSNEEKEKLNEMYTYITKKKKEDKILHSLVNNGVDTSSNPSLKRKMLRINQQFLVNLNATVHLVPRLGEAEEVTSRSKRVHHGALKSWREAKETWELKTEEAEEKELNSKRVYGCI